MYTVNPRVLGTDTDNSFTNRLKVLKQHFTYKSNLTETVATNPPQGNCSVYNETHYGNFETGSTPANHLRVFDQTFEFLADLEAAYDSPVISDGELIFPEILACNILKDFWNYIYNGDSNEEIFLSSLNITFQNCVKIEKDTKNRSDCSSWFELCNPRITSSKCHSIFIRQRFETLCTVIINPYDFEDLPAKTLNHGKKSESRARELYIDVMKLKLRHFVLVRRTDLVNTTVPALIVAYQTTRHLLTLFKIKIFM